jgi:hypothetical protein
MAAPGPLALALLALLASSPAFNVTESDDNDSSSACSAIASIGALDVCIGRIAAGTVLAMQLTAKIDCPDGAAAHACMDLSAPRSAPLMVTGSASSQNSTASPGLYRSNYSWDKRFNNKTTTSLRHQAENEWRLVQKLQAYIEWAKVEPRLVGLMPWHYNDRCYQHMGKFAPLCGGARTLPKVVAELQRIGASLPHKEDPTGESIG